ncbi:hypothetical protein VTN02DRAFT_6396 [Thermoascus thermophilus]
MSYRVVSLETKNQKIKKERMAMSYPRAKLPYGGVRSVWPGSVVDRYIDRYIYICTGSGLLFCPLFFYIYRFFFESVFFFSPGLISFFMPVFISVLSFRLGIRQSSKKCRMARIPRDPSPCGGYAMYSGSSWAPSFRRNSLFRLRWNCLATAS